MSKSILVIDMPENCNECGLHALTECDYDKEFYCVPNGKMVDEFASSRTKPDWCPLMELPQKTAEENRWLSEDYAKGRNACIDEILKGDEVE